MTRSSEAIQQAAQHRALESELRLQPFNDAELLGDPFVDRAAAHAVCQFAEAIDWIARELRVVDQLRAVLPPDTASR